MKTELVLANLKREKSSLDNKCEKLNAFIESDEYEEVSEIQQDLLNQQLNAMELYSFILEQRIEDIEFKEAFKKEIDNKIKEEAKEEEKKEENEGEEEYDVMDMMEKLLEGFAKSISGGKKIKVTKITL